MKVDVKVFADGANLEAMRRLNASDLIAGLTTNPTLMKKAGITNYENFCRQVLEFVTSKPISFEVFADEFDEMERQAKVISSWGNNVYVKIPVMNTKGQSCYDTVKRLTSEGVKVNATAVFTLSQIDGLIEAIDHNTESYISVFAGRIADAGFDPTIYISHAVKRTKKLENCEIIWASPREAFNIIEAGRLNCDIITATPELIAKIDKFGFDLEQFSLETVKMFYSDAQAAGYEI